MGKIIAVCGKLCGGKTYYSNRLKTQRRNAVLLSCDEILWELFHHSETDHDATVRDIKRYLMRKAAEITGAGCDVVLDWGFWSKAERTSVRAYYKERGIPTEWHYIDISDEEWQININTRNAAIEAGLSSDYFVDDGLRRKFISLFEAPKPSEIDVWHTFER